MAENISYETVYEYDTLKSGITVIAEISCGGEGRSELEKRREELTRAFEEYQSSLAKLKSQPNNPNLKEKTLGLGRNYSNLTRDKKGVTIFDEVASMNDINAACAGAANASLNRT